MTWQIIVRDSTLARIGEIDDYTTLDMTLRFNAFGAWILNMSGETDMADAMVAGAGIIVKRDGQTVMSGPIVSPQIMWDGDGLKLIVAGVTDDVCLTDRLVWPSASPFTASAYDVRTGVAETVMRDYVDANAGPGAAAERQVTGLTLAADGANGTTVTGRGRFQVLADLLRSLATSGGDLGFRVVQSGATLLFEVYVPTDRTATAIFSAGLEDLQSFDYKPEAPTGNWVLVAGGGEGTSRVFAEGSDPASMVRWSRRVETFRDRRDTTDADELAQTADEEIANQADRASLVITPIDTDAVTFLSDYSLGDKVTVDIGGPIVRDVVREVHIVVTPDGDVVIPTIGTSGTARNDLVGLITSIKTLRRKLSALERQ